MGDDSQDSWLGVLGIDVGQIRDKVQSVVSDVETTVDKGIDTVVAGATQVYKDVETGITQTVQNVENAGGAVVSAVKKVAQSFTPGASSGPIQADCKPVHGQVPGPPEHLLCQTHGHILNVNSGQIIAASLADYKNLSSSGMLGKIVGGLEDAGKAVTNAESKVLGGAKSAYDTVTDAYDAVVPNFTKANQDLGNLVDAGEAAAKKGNDAAAAQYQDVPILGSLLKASAVVGDATADALGGVVKGAGDLATMAGNAVFHPIDAAVSLGEGALGIAEHVPIVPGLNTAVKAAHGLVDLAEGKKDGKYGGSLTDLGENLLLDTQQDPNDPSKRTNTDVEFLAGMGGGTKTWSEKPMEAATRTLTNLAPMLLGDEAAGANTGPEEPPVPPEVDPLGKTQVDPLGKTQVDPFGKTQDLGKTQVDPANPEPEPDAPKVDPAATPEQIRQNLIDTNAAQKATQEASIKATQEYVRYRAKMPEPARGFAGDPNWDPRVDEALYNETLRAEQANIRAIKNLQAWQKAAKAAQGLG